MRREEETKSQHSFVDVNDHFRESPIIGSKEKYKRFIVDKLGPHFVEARMIYNARNDGWKASNFHEKCDGQGPTVSLI